MKSLRRAAGASLLLRVGLSIVFLYASLSAFISPQEWVGFLPPLLTGVMPAETLLIFFSIYELCIAFWLLSGLYIRYAAGLTILTLGGIVLSNFSLLMITFRDIALMCAAGALMLLDEGDR